MKHFDTELLATEYANQYPEKDYHDLQHAFIAGVAAYSITAVERIKALEKAYDSLNQQVSNMHSSLQLCRYSFNEVLKDINSELPKIKRQRELIKNTLNAI